MKLALTLFLLVAGGWTPERQEHLIQCADKIYDSQISAYPSFHYPFSAIKGQRLKEQTEESVTLFSYGSLINLASACKTLPEAALDSRTPAVAFGVKRLFNYDPEETSLGPPKDPEYRAMLNLEKTNDPKNLVNGVVMEIPRENLIDLCERERGYDLVPVLCTLWEEALAVEGGACPKFFIAYTFLSPPDKRDGRIHTNPNIQPRPDYYQLVKEGATEYGPDYLKLFIETTYAGDGKTIAEQDPKLSQ